MTQEELDALMGGDVDIDALDDNIQSGSGAELADEIIEEVETSKELEDIPAGYSEETSHRWPLPATDENKMVHQLDDVTKESEEKATEIFDIIENISNELMEKEENVNKTLDVLNSNVELFAKLHDSFPDVQTFKTQLEKNESALEDANVILEMLQNSGDDIMNVMDIMQYQDIHRQKIERVINVMRALSKYMNTLFESKVDDSQRVSSAQHIVGDTHNDVASTDDIEALLEQFGK